MRKVLVLCRYGALGASSRLRFLQYLGPLEKDGAFEFTVVPLLDDDYLKATYSDKTSDRMKMAIPAHFKRILYLLRARKFDFIWLQSEIFPFAPAFFERCLPALNIPYVVDYDDAIFHRYDRSDNPVVKCILGQKISTVMRSAKVVIAGNEYLAEYALQAGCKTVIEIPTVVDHTRYTPRKESISARQILGWIGTPATSKYLRAIAPALDQLGSKMDLGVHLIGADPSIASAFSMIKPKILKWREDTEAKEIEKFSLGIMPLAGHDWDEGKCGYKIVQYMACGVPSLATHTRANEKIIEAGSCGTTLKKGAHSNDWADIIQNMISDPQRLYQMGHSGREAVEKQYSVKAQIPALKNALLRTSRII